MLKDISIVIKYWFSLLVLLSFWTEIWPFYTLKSASAAPLWFPSFTQENGVLSALSKDISVSSGISFTFYFNVVCGNGYAGYSSQVVVREQCTAIKFFIFIVMSDIIKDKII